MFVSHTSWSIFPKQSNHITLLYISSIWQQKANSCTHVSLFSIVFLSFQFEAVTQLIAHVVFSELEVLYKVLFTAIMVISNLDNKEHYLLYPNSYCCDSDFFSQSWHQNLVIECLVVCLTSWCNIITMENNFTNSNNLLVTLFFKFPFLFVAWSLFLKFLYHKRSFLPKFHKRLKKPYFQRREEGRREESEKFHARHAFFLRSACHLPSILKYPRVFGAWIFWILTFIVKRSRHPLV